MHQSFDVCHYCSLWTNLSPVQRAGRLSPSITLIHMVKERGGYFDGRPKASGPVVACWECVMLFSYLRKLLAPWK